MLTATAFHPAGSACRLSSKQSLSSGPLFGVQPPVASLAPSHAIAGTKPHFRAALSVRGQSEGRSHASMGQHCFGRHSVTAVSATAPASSQNSVSTSTAEDGLELLPKPHRTPALEQESFDDAAAKFDWTAHWYPVQFSDNVAVGASMRSVALPHWPLSGRNNTMSKMQSWSLQIINTKCTARLVVQSAVQHFISDSAHEQGPEPNACVALLRCRCMGCGIF